MATNYKRKTPCQSVKRGFIDNPATLTIWCNCCGEWFMRHHKFFRTVRQMQYRPTTGR